MIKVQNLTKRYGNHIALNNLNFTVNKGEILGFLGPNGAGKSTTMNIITGYLSVTEGSVQIDEIDILEEPIKVKQKIGYLPESPPLYNDMTVKEYLLFVCKLKKIPKKEIDMTINKVCNLVKIHNVHTRLIKNLSKGYKQRVGLSQALIGDPEVLILDEPTVGLDPKQIIEIRNLVKDLSKNHTVILSSHILSEISAVCDRVIIINKGELVASDSPDNLSKRINPNTKLKIRIKGPEKDIYNRIKSIDGIKYASLNKTTEKGAVELIIEANLDTDVREDIFAVCRDNDYPILLMQPVNKSLEDIFIEVTSQQKKEGETIVSDL